MKIQYNGTSAVEVPALGLELVAPGEVLEIPAHLVDVAGGLLLAGSTCVTDDDGDQVVIAAEQPLWTLVEDAPPPADPTTTPRTKAGSKTGTTTPESAAEPAEEITS